MAIRLVTEDYEESPRATQEGGPSLHTTNTPRNKKNGRVLKVLMSKREALYAIIVDDASEDCLEEVAQLLTTGNEQDLASAGHHVSMAELANAMRLAGEGARLIRLTGITTERRKELGGLLEGIELPYIDQKVKKREQERQKRQFAEAFGRPKNFDEVTDDILTRIVRGEEGLVEKIEKAINGQIGASRVDRRCRNWGSGDFEAMLEIIDPLFLLSDQNESS